MRPMPQERTATGQIFPSPRPGEVMFETPPAFCWRKVPGAPVYTLVVADADGHEIFRGETARNFLVPDAVLEPGCYRWNLYAGDMERGWQDFSIAASAVRLPRPTAAALFDAVPACRPRHLFFASDIPGIIREKSQQLETLRRNIDLALEEGLPVPPRFHLDEAALPYREYFGRHRDFCDRNLVACALGHALLGDERATRHGVSLLMTLCDWNPEGPCSLEDAWGDEIGLSHARCLPAVYDLLFDALTERQRAVVERTIAAYAAQCERRLRGIDFCQNPGDSHAGRLPAYLGEAAMVLKGTDIDQAMLVGWLEYALDIYGSFFPYFGGPDGGWAEGTFYSTSYTKWFLPFFMAVERYLGFSFLDRPFYQRYIDFLQHFCPPGWEIHPFGDGYWCHSQDAEWPGFFAQNPYHIYAERFGSRLTRTWARQSAAPDIFRLHLLDVFLPEGQQKACSLAGGVTRARAFPDAGFVSLHTCPQQPQQELALVARASRYGSYSHQHADQASFALMAGGTAMISPSGYFGRGYGTAHHRLWTQTTQAHNTILVDGAGQENRSYRATGKVVFAREQGDVLQAQVDATAAYPMLTSFKRSLTLEQNRLIVHDEIRADHPVEITWLLHTLSRPEMGEEGICVSRGGHHLDILPVHGGLSGAEIRDTFAVDLNEGEPEAFHVDMPAQYHIRWHTPKACAHDIEVHFLLDTPEK
nr:heparinase II/III family protein [bacterium]